MVCRLTFHAAWGPWEHAAVDTGAVASAHYARHAVGPVVTFVTSHDHSARSNGSAGLGLASLCGPHRRSSARGPSEIRSERHRRSRPASVVGAGS